MSDDHARSRAPFLPAVCAAAGVLAIVGSVLVPRFLRGGNSPGPGKLVAKQDALSWQGPAEKVDRPLTAVRATFEVRNVGGAPVRILEAQSSCGCAAPSVRPAIIPPGGVGVVEVEAGQPDIGERNVTVTLRTDSAATPEVLLRLRLVGNRRPPYLASAYGELTFEGDLAAEGPRSIVATTVELAATNPTPPRLASSLKALDLGPAILSHESLYEQS